MIHDLVIRIISEYLRDEQTNTDIVKLISLNQRFYGIRDMFIKQLILKCGQSNYAYLIRPYGWNTVRSIILFKCLGNNVSILSKIHTVQLLDWSNLDDISGLGKCYSVTIERCNGVCDVSVLKTCHSVALRYCPSIFDVSDLSTVKYLHIIGCHNIIDVSKLYTVKWLTLYNCDGIRDVSNVQQGVPNLTIFYCKNLIHGEHDWRYLPVDSIYRNKKN